MPDHIELDTGIGDGFNQDPWDSKDCTDDSDTDDTPPRSLRRPGFACNDRDKESADKDDGIPPLRHVSVLSHQAGIAVFEAVEGGSTLDEIDGQTPERLLQRPPEFDEYVEYRESIVNEIGSGLESALRSFSQT